MKQPLFILHSLNGNTEFSFRDSVTNIAQNLNYTVIYPQFAISQDSNYQNFKQVLHSFIANIDDETVFICHSISANYLIKYIAEYDFKIKAMISVGGAIELSPMEKESSGYNKQVKLNSLPTADEIEIAKKNIKDIYLYYSDNDHHSTPEMFANFINTLNAKPILCKGYGHFTLKNNVNELPNIKDLLELLKTK